MKTAEQIAAVEADGYTVTIQHWRAHRNQVKDALRARARGMQGAQPALAPQHLFEKGDIASHGGKTVCIISLEEQEIVRGEAVCSPEDNFRKSYGRDKAVGRAVAALKQLEGGVDAITRSTL